MTSLIANVAVAAAAFLGLPAGSTYTMGFEEAIDASQSTPFTLPGVFGGLNWQDAYTMPVVYMANTTTPRTRIANQTADGHYYAQFDDEHGGLKISTENTCTSRFAVSEFGFGCQALYSYEDLGFNVIGCNCTVHVRGLRQGVEVAAANFDYDPGNLTELTSTDGTFYDGTLWPMKTYKLPSSFLAQGGVEEIIMEVTQPQANITLYDPFQDFEVWAFLNKLKGNVDSIKYTTVPSASCAHDGAEL